MGKILGDTAITGQREREREAVNQSQTTPPHSLNDWATLQLGCMSPAPQQPPWGWAWQAAVTEVLWRGEEWAELWAQ